MCTTFASLAVGSQPKPTQTELLKKTIHEVVELAHRKAAVGIKIMSLKSDRCFYEKNPNKVFIPASNTKAFTSAAALALLGPHYRFETILATNTISHSRKISNLYIKGGGDPSFETMHLEEMVKQLQAQGIREIRGNIVIDASIFDSSAKAPGWNKADGPIFDKSPVNGLMINHSCITVRLQPAKIPGHKPRISLDPAVDYITVVNKARTTQTAKKHSLHVFRSRQVERKIFITGTIAKKSKQKGYLVVLDNPHLYTAHVLQLLLKKYKIACRGAIVMGTTPDKVRVVARHYSEPVSSLIRTVLKSSDNLYSDALFKKMGAVTFGKPGSWLTGKKALELFLRTHVGITDPELELFDGSGLSHANRVSPNHLAQLLTWCYKKTPYRDFFIDALPISGVDGTLKHRMKNKAVHSKVKAKTGNLPGVSSLAGYITTKKDNPLLIVIIVNRKNKSAIEFKKKLEDHLCTLLAAHAFSV